MMRNDNIEMNTMVTSASRSRRAKELNTTALCLEVELLRSRVARRLAGRAADHAVRDVADVVLLDDDAEKRRRESDGADNPDVLGHQLVDVLPERDAFLGGYALGFVEVLQLLGQITHRLASEFSARLVVLACIWPDAAVHAERHVVERVGEWIVRSVVRPDSNLQLVCVELTRHQTPLDLLDVGFDADVLEPVRRNHLGNTCPVDESRANCCDA